MGYAIGRKLGKGGFATVFETQKDGKAYALKCVKTTSMKPAHAAKFRAELIIHSKLQHANIVQFVEAYPDSKGEETHMVLELCTNGSLKEMQGKREILSYPEIRRIGVQLAGALHYLHSRAVVHRDLKLQNILLDSNMNIKLADFGLVGMLKNDDDKDIVKRMTLCGTPNYMAPEMWGRHGHDQKLDMWAYGAVLFYLAVGWAPFSKVGDKNVEAIKQRANAIDVQWPDEGALPPELRSLLEVTMAMEEDKRPEAKQVIDYSFFKMRGGMPLALDPDCCERAPTWINSKRREMWAYAMRMPLEELIAQCGFRTTSQKSIIREIEKEEYARLAPTLPLKSTYRPKPPGRTLSDSTTRPRKASEKHKLEQISCIGPSDPTETLLGPSLSKLSTNLRRVLRETQSPSDPYSYPVVGPYTLPPPLVHCWLSHRLGFGYMLSNNDVGAILNNTPSGFLSRSNTPNTMTFIERSPRPSTSSSIASMSISASQSQDFRLLHHSLAFSKSSLTVSDKHTIQRDTATKVCTAFTKHLHKKRGSTPPCLTSSAPCTPPLFVSTFARLGSCLAFSFSCGGLQFNFPDHTKLILSGDASFATFYHLPLPTALAVRSGAEKIPKNSANGTSTGTGEDGNEEAKLVLHMPLAVMLSYSIGMNQWLKEIAEANELRQKAEFVRDVIRVWEVNGGVGQGREKLDWNGMTWPQGQEGDGEGSGSGRKRERSWGVVEI